MKVLVIDSSVQLIERFQQLLGEGEGITSVHGAVSYKDGARNFYEHNPEIVLIDMNLPENEAIRLLDEIKDTAPDCRVVGLSMSTEADKRYSKADLIFDKYHEFEMIPAAIEKLIKETKNN